MAKFWLWMAAGWGASFFKYAKRKELFLLKKPPLAKERRLFYMQVFLIGFGDKTGS